MANNSNPLLDPSLWGQDDEAAGVPPAYSRYTSTAGPGDIVDPPKGAQRGAPKPNDSDDYTVGAPAANNARASSNALDDAWDWSNSKTPPKSRPSLDIYGTTTRRGRRARMMRMRATPSDHRAPPPGSPLPRSQPQATWPNLARPASDLALRAY